MTAVLPFIIIFLVSLNSWGATYQVRGFENKYGDYSFKFSLEKKGSTVQSRYTLPLDLTGTEVEIIASGEIREDGRAVLTGPNVELRCEMAEELCSAKYKYMPIDLQAVQTRLESRGLLNDQVEHQLMISRHFGGEPIGFIQFNSADDVQVE